MATVVSFAKLLEPSYIGRIKTRNRIIKTAAGTGFLAQDSLQPSRQAISFYEAIARGGVGLLIVEYPAIFLGEARTSRINEDKYIPGLSELTKVIHKYSCPTFVQIEHMGPFTLPSMTVQPVAASARKIDSILDMHRTTTRALAVPEIEEIKEKIINSALRAQKAGFDGIELNAGSSHLFATFLSRFWNSRQDEYGCGSMQNRARIVVDIIQGIKKRLGQDFPISVLMNGIEVDATGAGQQELCLTIEESRLLAKILVEAGADALHIRSHWLGNHIPGFLPELLYYPEPCIPLKTFPKELDTSNYGVGSAVPLAALIKQSVSVPIITVGKLDPVLGERILEQGKADFIGLNRRLFADPELPNKIMAGNLEDITPCTACSTCLSSPGIPSSCRVNAAFGTEDGYTIHKAEKRKKVLVVGGGPSGMEAARMAALRGHQVILCDESPKLGGLMTMASLVKGSHIEKIPDLTHYLSKQVVKLGVDLRLGKAVNLTVIKEIKPDVIILASGGISITPDIPGIDNKNVVGKKQLYNSLSFFLRFMSPKTIRWLTKFWMPLGKRVVIIGGDIQGCQLAEFLVKRGRKVTIVEETGELGKGLLDHVKIRLLPWLQKKGVLMLTGVHCDKISETGLTITTRDRQKQIIPADSIIPALPLSPNTALIQTLKGHVTEIYSIGDCSEPGLIVDAVAAGWRIARAI